MQHRPIYDFSIFGRTPRQSWWVFSIFLVALHNRGFARRCNIQKCSKYFLLSKVWVRQQNHEYPLLGIGKNELWPRRQPQSETSQVNSFPSFPAREEWRCLRGNQDRSGDDWRSNEMGSIVMSLLASKSETNDCLKASYSQE
jgi:hypothetical protein